MEINDLLNLAMAIAHERELEVLGHPHDTEGAVRRFNTACQRMAKTINRRDVAQPETIGGTAGGFDAWIKREYPHLGPIGDGVVIAREAWSAAIEYDRKKFGRNDSDNRKRCGEPTEIADALSAVDWSGVSIGNKVLIKAAIEALRQRGGEPVAWLVNHVAADPFVTLSKPDKPKNHLAACEVEVIPLYAIPQPAKPTKDRNAFICSSCEGVYVD